jgi:hypothetical protein
MSWSWRCERINLVATVMQSSAKTPTEYLASLPPERRRELAAVRSVIKEHLPKGFVETMQYGMITYVVPLKVYPAGYLGKKDVPVPYASLAAQKGHLALYLMCVYGNPKLERWFKSAWEKSGKKLDMGKSCVRFKSADALALEVIAEAIERTPVKDFVELYEATRRGR